MRQCEALVAVVEEGSVSEAARRLRLTPGAVSVAIDEVERTLGLQLVVRRRGRGAAVTPAGLAAAGRARALLGLRDGLVGLRDELAGELVGTLRIGCFATLSPWLLPPVAAHFARAHPSVDLVFTEAGTREVLDRLDRGDLDAAVMYARHMPAHHEVREIGRTRLHVVLAADHPLAGRASTSLAAVAEEPAILLDLEPSLSHVEELVRAAGHAPDVRWRSTNAETIRSLVARGLGYSVIMGRPAGDRSVDGLPLAYVPISDDLDPARIVIARAPGAVEDARVRAVGDYLAEYCRGRDALAAAPEHDRERAG